MRFSAPPPTSPSNRLTAITPATGPTRAYTYDAAGNVLTDSRGAGYAYTYDAAGRMASMSINGVLQGTYKYDSAGRQAIRTTTSPAITIHSVFDSQGRRIAEYNQATGAVIREYVWLNWEPIAVIEGSVISYIRTDHIGRPILGTNSVGTKIWTASYTPFGGVRTTTGTPINARFPGQWFQSESGLHQNWMRDYDPTTGRYLQADPLGLVDGASVYGYVWQSPTMYTDPRGEETTVYISYPPDDPWDPGHAFMSTNSMIYDPNGGGCACQAVEEEPDLYYPGSGNFYDRDLTTDSAFFNYASFGGWIVNSYTFPTSVEEEKMIESRIEEFGGGGYLGCAISVSSVLNGIGPFNDLGTYRRPSRLEGRLQELLK